MGSKMCFQHFVTFIFTGVCTFIGFRTTNARNKTAVSTLPAAVTLNKAISRLGLVSYSYVHVGCFPMIAAISFASL